MSKLINKYSLILGSLFMSAQVFAEEHEAAAAAATSATWTTALAVGFGMALAVIAASTAQGKIAASYMDGVSRNPSAQKAMGTQLILSLVFVETLVLFTFAIVYLLMGKM